MHYSSQEKSETQYQESKETVPDDKASFEGESQNADFTIVCCLSEQLQYLSVSPNIFELSQRKNAEYLGKTLTEVPLLPIQNEQIVETIQSIFRDQAPKEFQITEEEKNRGYKFFVAPQISERGLLDSVVVTVQVKTKFPPKDYKENSKIFSQINHFNLHTLFSKFPLGIALVSNTRHFLGINPALERMWGYSREEIVNFTLANVTHPDDLQQSLAFARKVDRHELEFFSLEKRYICKDGHMMWGRVTACPFRDIDGNPLFQLALIEDISAIKQTEKDLENERLFMKYVMESTFDSIYFKDLENRFIRVNYGTIKKFGLNSGEDIIGKTDFDFFSREIAQVNFDEEKKIIETGEPLINAEGQETWRDRNPTWVSSSKIPVRDTAGTIIGTFGISRDITEHKQKEAEIRQLNRQLEKRVAERTKELLLINKELEEFTYTVSHDLKAPLRGISGYSSLLLQEHSTQLDDEGKNFLQKLVLSAEQLSDLIDDLLTYSRLERREITYTNISVKEITQIVVDQFLPQIEEKHIKIHLNLDSVMILSSYDLLLQIIHNYFENAIKFSLNRNEPEIWIDYKNQGKTSILSIRDNGIGFDNVYAEKIFEIFQRLNRADNYAGTGIGLALVKKAAAMLGYRVWGEGKLDEGAVFYLEINNELHL